jgi:uncharacterized membrane protein YvbJ
MIICSQCNTVNDDDASFCIGCGTKLSFVQPAESNPATQNISVAVSSKVTPLVERDEVAYCRNCGSDVPENSIGCMECGLPPLKARNYCCFCGKKTDPDAVLCIHCKKQFKTNKSMAENKDAAKEVATQNVVQPSESAEVLTDNNDDKIKCPRCGSAQIHVHKKGYSAGKGCCAAAACGPFGFLFGQAGANKIKKTCLKCNNSWT